MIKTISLVFVSLLVVMFFLIIFIFINKSNVEIEFFNKTNQTIKVSIYYLDQNIIDKSKIINIGEVEFFKAKTSAFFSDEKILIKVIFPDNHNIIERSYLASGDNFFKKNTVKYEIYNDDILFIK